MKIFIITEGGKDIGLGHVARCCSLYDAFARRGTTPTFVLNGSTAKGLLKNRRKKVFDWLRDDRKLFSMVAGADIAVIDSYLAPSAFYKKISELVNTLAYLDDNKRLDYPRGIVINGAIYAEEVKYPRGKDTAYLLGSQYAPLRKEFQKGLDKKIKDSIKNVMVTFGGDDIRNMTPRILRFLNKNHPRLIKNVIIGGAFRGANVKDVKALKEKNVNLVYRPDAARMIKIMTDSDIAISAGGQTLYELARIGVPTIGICVADSQLLNIKGWVKTGFLRYAGQYDRKDVLVNVESAINSLQRKKMRQAMSSAGRKSVDGRGAERVINAVL